MTLVFTDIFRKVDMVELMLTEQGLLVTREEPQWGAQLLFQRFLPHLLALPNVRRINCVKPPQRRFDLVYQPGATPLSVAELAQHLAASFEKERTENELVWTFLEYKFIEEGK